MRTAMFILQTPEGGLTNLRREIQAEQAEPVLFRQIQQACARSPASGRYANLIGQTTIVSACVARRAVAASGSFGIGTSPRWIRLSDDFLSQCQAGRPAHAHGQSQVW